jgi:hypothetical protein
METVMCLDQHRRNLGRTAFLAALLLAFSLSSSAAELTRPLTSEEVACNEQQLENLLQRMNAAKERYNPLPQLSTTLLVSYSNSAGFYDGLVLTDQKFRLDIGGIPPVDFQERYLAFNINPSIRSLLLNPRRPELDQVSLNREQSASNLVPPGGYFDLVLTLDPTLGGGDQLVINNFEEPVQGEPYNGFLANSTKPGRGLATDGLLTPCHNKITSFDRHVFAILQRMARGADPNAFFRPDSELSIFRGTDPDTYRINYYPIFEHFEERGRFAVEVELSWTPEGKLTTGILRPLEVCQGGRQYGCTILKEMTPLVFLIPPVLGGVEYYPNSTVANAAYYIWDEGPSEPRNVNFEELLAHTTWNEPVW